MKKKLLTLASLRRLRAAARRDGRTVALANGCFDLLHAGHVRYLQDAKRRCDLLIVALNSDRSVRRIKGKGRPVQAELERAEIISALACVDYVMIFDDPDVHRLLRALRPDFHCKGTDYTEGTVPERDTALEIGTRVVICGDPKDHSTRDLIARIARPAPRRS